MLTEKIFSFAQAADEAILIFLLLLSCISIGLILERFFTLRRVKKDSDNINKRISIALQTYNLEDIEYIANDIHTLEGRALSYGLKHLKENGSQGLEEIFNAFVHLERPKLDRYLSVLATIGSTAPYIGLLGTVLGIMKAFNDLSTASEAGQATVMAGISVALVATAIGLFVAIPAVVFFNYYQRQVKSILMNLEGVKELCTAYAVKKSAKES